MDSLPDDIQYLIFDMLDLDDRKALAQTCGSLNSIFSQPRYINDVWLKIKKRDSSTVQSLLSSSKVYRRLIWNEAVPVAIIQHLSPNLTHLKVEFSFYFLKYLQNSLSATFPHFAYLKHLEIKSALKDGEVLDLNRPQQSHERVSMENLEHLSTTDILYIFLDSNYIDFSTNKLRTVELTAVRGGLSYFHQIPMSDFYRNFRDFIARQEDLESLSLQESEIFYDEPFVLQSKLKEFNTTSYLTLNATQATNYLDFLESQDKLEIFRSQVFFPAVIVQRVQQMQQKVWNLRLKNIRINYYYIGYYTSFLTQVVPNQSIRELRISTHRNGQASTDTFALNQCIAQKCPNATRMCVDGMWSDDDYNALNGLNFANITELVLNRFRNVNNAVIPNLRYFEFQSVLFIYSEQPIEIFFVRHQEIEKIRVNFNHRWSRNSKFAENLFVDMVDFVLENLTNLKEITVANDELGYNKLSALKIKSIIKSVADHAQPGFKFISIGLQVFKRYDMKVAWKCEGRKLNVKLEA